ncbi:MAG TPA: aldehyde ferredoxin oxidoreductase C-terminal domain-containing protein [Tenuifilaceae bacterium]|nr:aldehyde ferredoxin oxidoreductase C-terminal domain-containing protein [Tenuifilaceae bacterium]HPI44684.1 aldehyde ferredoxin oxidoreductase C-terminal domain-containing protein [Tenuifilaceae bacterium]HPN20551.1 aldehyde ferredoxin oxidoreductase C-terminal domain-containing protein [Tenuifilaceae bacterium]
MITSNPTLKLLMIDAASGFYKVQRYNVGDFFGPVDLGIHLAHKYNSLNVGVGLLAGSIFPGSNRLIVNGISPSWHGFFISSMGGAGLVFDNLGINMFSIVGKTPTPSILYLNRIHGEEIEVELIPVKQNTVWSQGRGGVYSMMQHTLDLLGSRYENDPRILAAGPASLHTDFGAIASAPIKKGEVTFVDTWAGRGGFGTKMVQQHGIVSIIYGGTYVDDDFRDRSVADSWFEDRYQKRLAAKDMEATTKYRFDPKFETGGTFGVNYATLKGDTMAFNYRTIYMTEEERLKIHKDFIVDHYLKQFNEETIKTKQQKTCGEPCSAVCKKMQGEFKKDYEPYQTMGPLCGIFDQRAAEKINHYADMLGFDAISIGGVLSWLMDCVVEGLIKPEELGITGTPIFNPDGFKVVEDSMHNANIGIALMDQMVNPKGVFHMKEGARKLARHFARRKGTAVLDKFVYVGFARSGWTVPNQYWTPGVLSPMAIMGKYYMYYGKDFVPPRQLGRENAKRMLLELVMDNLGMCRFHRAWAEDILPEVIESLYGLRDKFQRSLLLTASRINSRNASIFWESERNIDYVFTFLKKKKEVDGVNNPELDKWISAFETDKRAAALDFWYELHKGIHESLLEFH